MERAGKQADDQNSGRRMNLSNEGNTSATRRIGDLCDEDHKKDFPSNVSKKQHREYVGAQLQQTPGKDEQVGMPMISQKSNISRKVATFIARNPLRMILGTIGFILLVSILCLLYSDFELTDENKKGWKSRGTPISMRGMQGDVIRNNSEALFYDATGEVWEKLTAQNPRGYFFLAERLAEPFALPRAGNTTKLYSPSLPLMTNETCGESSHSYLKVFENNNMVALWEAGENSLLDPDVIEGICDAEEQTLMMLKDKSFCGSCSEGQCLQPLSLTLVLRKYIINGEGMNCPEIRQAYESVEDKFTNNLISCVNEMKVSLGLVGDDTKCPLGFHPVLVDAEFGVNGNSFLRYSTSYFHTFESDQLELFQEMKSLNYDTDGHFKVSFDTSKSSFQEFTINEVVMVDMVIAATSAMMVCVVIAIHTGSMWLLCMGLLQIIFATPLAYAVYRFIVGIRFFSLLNLIGLFISAALGADDLFVSTDKWKHKRIQHPTFSTEEIAEIALPEAAYAMFLTTSTTAVAFFASCLSPVAPIFCFAVFCGLMVIFNFILNCTLIFPSLCMYDRWIRNGSASWFVDFPSLSDTFCRRKLKEEESREAIVGKNSNSLDAAGNTEDLFRPIQRRLGIYYSFLHKSRWLVLLLCTVMTGVGSYYAQTISLPDEIFVQMLPVSNPLVKQSRVYREDLLSSFLVDQTTGSSVTAYFGVTVDDTGNHNEPDELSTIVLDDNFDPSTTEAQIFLLDFCDRLFSKPYVYKAGYSYRCSINIFDEWLGVQSLLPPGDKASDYNSVCKGAGSLPMPEEDFHSCFIYWSKLVSDLRVLEWGGKVRILVVHGGSAAKVTQSLGEINDGWVPFEEFQEEELKIAPLEASFFLASELFWAADTYNAMQSTGLGSLYISVAFAAFVVLISSTSLVCSFISAMSIYFILVISIATLVGLGWELGFLEWICFAILVGISADFVIHISNSYCLLPGHRSREERTRFALMSMGPSVLGSASTTFTVAFMMLFCKVVFFIRFAQMLAVTILYSLFGACVFYIVITDIAGPIEPTKTATRIKRYLSQVRCAKRCDASHRGEHKI